MLKKILRSLTLSLTGIFFISLVHAGIIKGSVTNQQGAPIPYASVFLKNSKGTTADGGGRYSMTVTPGTYTLTCQYIGYAEKSLQITVHDDSTQTVNFVLDALPSQLEEVTILSRKKDPSEQIIRNAIRMKPRYRTPLDAFTCEVYIKMQIQSRSLPKSVFFKKIDQQDKKDMGVDSNGKGSVYLSESLTQYAFQKPRQTKLHIVSGRESGSNGYGFNFPTFIDFYQDNVQVLSIAGSRGFVSPIADGAFHYYHFSYMGFFRENEKKVHRIRVVPRRKYEPLFDGEIDITDGDWRIYSLDVLLTKESQVQLLDTIRLQQQATPIAENIWQNSKQVIHFSFNVLGFNMFGNVLNVYNKYDPHPVFSPHYFNNVVAEYNPNVRKKDSTYWDSVRPVQLTQDERTDFVRKDSSFRQREDSLRSKPYQDSLARKREHFTVGKILMGGYYKSFRNDSGKTTDLFQFQPLLYRLQYNTVEGISLNSYATWMHLFPKHSLSFSPHLRYGFSNGHFNPEGTLSWSVRRDSTRSMRSYARWSLSGGKRLSQYNNEAPITPLVNAFYTLANGKNYMKLYENDYGMLSYNLGTETGWTLRAYTRYENRRYVSNSTDYSFRKNPAFTPNYPTELLSGPFRQHQAFLVGFQTSYQPGQRYIQYPHYKTSIGSTMPTFHLAYQKGIAGLLGSDVHFDKWSAGISNSTDFRLGGLLKYQLQAGGFLNKNTVFIQDYQHFNGNQTIFASAYLNSFQLSPYYANSTTAGFYLTGHAEHHFNGMLTNKIPLFRRLNWNLVAGSNAFYVNPHNNYVEVFGGLENVFKIYRIDFVQSFLNGNKGQFGVRVGIGGLFSAGNNSLELQ